MWLNHVWKPVWVDKHPTTLLEQLGPPPPASFNATLSFDCRHRNVVGRDIVLSPEAVNELCEKGQLSEAVDGIRSLLDAQTRVSASVFFTVLRRCVAQRNLRLGRQVHELITEVGYDTNTCLSNHIIRMYASQGRLQEANDVFTRVAKPDVFSWSAIIAVHAKHGEPKQAVALYQNMRSSRVKPDSHVFVAALQACARAADLESGKQVHADVLQSGIQHNICVWNSLLDMYAKCGRLKDARTIFDSLDMRDVVTWNAMIAGYSEHKLVEEALLLYEQMELERDVRANSVTFACLLKACTRIGALQRGKQLHSQIVERGLGSDAVVGTCLVDMYAKCGRLDEARTVFESLLTRNVVTWTAMITGYVEHERCQDALSLYDEMEQEGAVFADPVTFACLLKACASARALQQGRRLHLQIVRRGLECDALVGTCLVDMYVKCDRLEDARMIFDNLAARNVVTWTAMIAGYADHGQGQEALSLYSQMEREAVAVADPFVFACLLKSCASVGAIQQGKLLHSQILEKGLESDKVVGTCLVDMYVKCGLVEDARRAFDSLVTMEVATWNAMITGYSKFGMLDEARKLFDTLDAKDVITWNVMITGYAEHGPGQEALALYEQMEKEGGNAATLATFVGLLKACAKVGALQQGKQVHSQVIGRGLAVDPVIVTCLIDMYVKCGKLEDACRVFDSLPNKDVGTWTVMIDGFGQSNEGHQAIQCYKDMVRDGVQANETTLTCLLVACSHQGLVKEGQQLFKKLVEEGGIMPTAQHYTCMVDLLGRAGYLDEAEKMLLSYKSYDDVGLMSLLNASKCFGDLERGIRCFESLTKSNPKNAAAYVLMGNIYADAGRWSDAERVERKRKSVGASKKPAVAGIEVDRHVQTFIVGAEGEVSSRVRSMSVRLQEEGGHVPHMELVLKQVPDEKKEDDLCGHAEKLALAYGLMNTPDGTPLLVTKNLRMCGDCHSSTEIMSRIERREIVVRDAHRVHRFVNGTCGCGGRP